MKTHVITVSRTFPKTHKRAGELTNFIDKIIKRNSVFYEFIGSKKHTIRSNYTLWSKRINDVNDGKAVLSIRFWEDKPYRSKQVEICRLDKSSGIGIQKVEFVGATEVKIDGKYFQGHVEYISNNDGLSFDDFLDWFKSYPKQPMAIIHFTEFRY
jgi:hypothetical protein